MAVNDIAAQVRSRLWLYLSPTVAADVGLTFEQLQQILTGGFTPTDKQLAKLARRMKLS